MSKDEDVGKPRIANSRDPIAEASDAIGRMCDSNNISKGSVPTNIADVPAAIAAILKERPAWGMDNSHGRGW